jgi:hypothetical protein
MNLFILSLDPRECAIMMNDVHIVKIILEAVQMLSTCKRLLSLLDLHLGIHVKKTEKPEKTEKPKKIIEIMWNYEKRRANELDIPVYRVAHVNHPVCKWMRESYMNYCWTLDLVEAMHDEWRYRYGHDSTVFHKSYLVAMYLRENPPCLDSFPNQGLTRFALAMPDKYKEKDGDPVESYRAYYRGEKRDISSWKNRMKPIWWS